MDCLKIFLYYILYILPLYGTVWKNFSDDRFVWDCFTRVFSTLNALQCCTMVTYTLYQNLWNNFAMRDLNYYTPDYQTVSLMLFAAYLAVDGIMMLPDIVYKRNRALFLSLVHHFVGGYGIYLIGSQRKGMALGVYFAATEFSTPFLNFWWLVKKRGQEGKVCLTMFAALFYCSRIFTIPFLGYWIYANIDRIYKLPIVQKNMVLFGSLALTLLNTIWGTGLYFRLRSSGQYSS